jgi:hypothetical protein
VCIQYLAQIEIAMPDISRYDAQKLNLLYALDEMYGPRSRI